MTGSGFCLGNMFQGRTTRLGCILRFIFLYNWCVCSVLFFNSVLCVHAVFYFISFHSFFIHFI